MNRRGTSWLFLVAAVFVGAGCSENAYIGLREVDRADDGRGVELSFRGEGTILLQAENGRLAPLPQPSSGMDDADAGDMGTDTDIGGGVADAGAEAYDYSPHTTDQSNLCFLVDAGQYTQLFFSVYPTTGRDVILTARFYLHDHDGDDVSADCSAVFAQKSARLRLTYGDGGIAPTADAGASDSGPVDAGNGSVDSGTEIRDSGLQDASFDAGVADAAGVLNDGGTGS